MAFDSGASNLVAGDTNGRDDVFVRDHVTGRTERVSLSTSGAQGNDSSFDPSISADGRFVAFASLASNLTRGDHNGSEDIFLHDRLTGRTTLISITAGGRSGNGESLKPAISSDGRFVAFNSSASNLVLGDRNRFADVFVRDLTVGKTALVSVGLHGGPANSGSFYPAITAHGFVAFASNASNLVQGDTNGQTDIFLRDLVGRRTERMDVSSTGHQAEGGTSFDPVVSAAGRYVAFDSEAAFLVGNVSGPHVYVRDRRRGTTTMVGIDRQGNPIFSIHPALSEDGRYVAFQGGNEIFVRDRRAHGTVLASQSNSGRPGNETSFEPAISADGATVSFTSLATNLVSGDTNGKQDTFVRSPLG